jgi:ATP phosphoribosyltransferase
MDTLQKEITAAERILVPSGRDYEQCVQAFQETFDITVPPFKDRRLDASLDGRTYIRVKGKDVPGLIAIGAADLGLTGTDVCGERIQSCAGLLYQAIGGAMCTFDLIVPRQDYEVLSARLSNKSASPVVIATTYPRLLGRCAAEQSLNTALSGFIPSGSVEVMPQLNICDAIADIVETGNTARQNGLSSIRKLADIYPAVVWQASNKERA